MPRLCKGPTAIAIAVVCLFVVLFTQLKGTSVVDGGLRAAQAGTVNTEIVNTGAGAAVPVVNADQSKDTDSKNAGLEDAKADAKVADGKVAEAKNGGAGSNNANANNANSNAAPKKPDAADAKKPDAVAKPADSTGSLLRLAL